MSDLSKKISNIQERMQGLKVDAMISKMEKSGKGKKGDHKNVPDKPVDDLKNKTEPAAAPSVSIFESEDVSDEIADLEDKFPIPNFTQQLDDDFVKGLEVDLKKENALLPNEIIESSDDQSGESVDYENEFVEHDVMENNDDIDYENIEVGDEYFEADQAVFEYGDFETFLTLTAKNQYFIDALFDNIFAKVITINHCLFVELEKREILIEKNYFIHSVLSVIQDSDCVRFKNDFLIKDAFDIFDGNKVSKIVEAMCWNESFFANFQRNGYDNYVFNLLIEIVDGETSFLNGWFLRMPLGKFAFVDSSPTLQEERSIVTMAAEKPQDIKMRSSRIKKKIHVIY
jgi:hypothetical protein